MAKVLMFARYFPEYHPKNGQPTYFVEKLAASLNLSNVDLNNNVPKFDSIGYFNADYLPKNHTIRAGHRFKTGDYFSPRVWSDKSYRSKQITIAPDIEVKKTWDFEVEIKYYTSYPTIAFKINGNKINSPSILKLIALNDGFSDERDFTAWFNKPFEGQIICWNDKIESWQQQ